MAHEGPLGCTQRSTPIVPNPNPNPSPNLSPNETRADTTDCARVGGVRNGMAQDGNTLLHLAVVHNKLAILTYLLSLPAFQTQPVLQATNAVRPSP